MNSVRCSDFREVSMRSTIYIRYGDNMAPSSERLQYYGGRGGARGEGESEACVFKGCDGFFEIVPDFSVSICLQANPSRYYLLGFELRVYSYAPTGLPTPVCANVVEREILNCSAGVSCDIDDCTYWFNDSACDWIMGAPRVDSSSCKFVDGGRRPWRCLY